MLYIHSISIYAHYTNTYPILYYTILYTICIEQDHTRQRLENISIYERIASEEKEMRDKLAQSQRIYNNNINIHKEKVNIITEKISESRQIG